MAPIKIYFTDDIPIQGPKDESNSSGGSGGVGNIGNSSGASIGAVTGGLLVSISEESENDPQFGHRNTGNRGSKDNPKVHKVPFPAFKKSKDKDKDGNSIGGKNSMSKNNGLASNEKETSKIQHNKKDKYASRGSLPASGDSTDGLDKVSPMPIIKRKNSQIDLVASDNIGALTNGSTTGINGDEKFIKIIESHANSIEATESIESNPDALVTPLLQRPSSINLGDLNKSHNSMQVSQV